MTTTGIKLLDSNSQRARVPLASDKLSLMPHQEAMVHRCMAIENEADFEFRARERERGLDNGVRNPNYGVMCDPPGSGKTFVILALILHEVHTRKKVLKSMGLENDENCAGNDQNILVVPFNIYTQWEECIRACCGDELRFKSFVNYQDISSLFFSSDMLKKNDILLTTSLYYSNIASTLKSMNMRVRRVVFDEIDSISSLLDVPISADHIWFVSASFDKNKIGAFKSTENKRIMNKNTVKCDPTFVDDSITIPAPRHNDIVCFNKHIDRVLTHVLTKEEMKSVNARDFPAIRGASILKTANDEKELVVNILNDMTATIEHLERELNELTVMSNQIGAYSQELHDRKRAIEKRLAKLIESVEIFCVKMDDNHICRVTGEDGDRKENKHDESDSDKIARFLRIIDTKIKEEDDPDMRVILFSDHSSVFGKVVDALHLRGISCGELDGGDVKNMDHVLNKYKNDDLRVLMVNSSMYGCGMNLENTTDIFFMHALPNSRKEQVIGRAQRYGRMGKLNVWTLLHENEADACYSQGWSIPYI